jgi:hypothetical protein
MKTKIGKQARIDRAYSGRGTRMILAAQKKEKRERDHIRNMIVEEMQIQIATSVESAFQRSLAAESIRRSMRANRQAENERKNEKYRANKSVEIVKKINEATALADTLIKQTTPKRASWITRVVRRFIPAP